MLTMSCPPQLPRHTKSLLRLVDVLNDLLEKAQSELDDTRHAESSASHNLALLQQPLEDQFEHFNTVFEKADMAEFTTSLDAERDELAVTETSLAAVAA